MEVRNRAILTDTVQFYFDRRGIDEEIQFQFHERETGRIMVELHTASLVGYKNIVFIEKLVWALMPSGANYELVNVVKNVQGDTEVEIKETIEEIKTTITKTVEISIPAHNFLEESGEISPEAFEALKAKPEASPRVKNQRELPNIDTSTDVTMFPGKKKK